MEYVNFYERIYNITDIKLIAQKICNHYKLGELIEQKHIAIGYEDFNMIINTTTGKYFVKILNKSRLKSEQTRLVSIIEKVVAANVRVPKIYQVNGESIFELEINSNTLNIIVMDYIDGTNMLLLDRDFNENEICSVAQEMAKIDNIDFQVEPYYDEWTITNFESEYNKKVNKIEDEDKELVTKVYEEMKNLDFTKLKMSYIHGDIIKSNLILDRNHQIWVIDFSVLNYLPRIIELAVAVFGICLTNNRETTINNINLLINEYNKYNKLDDYEIRNLPVVFNAISAMNVLQTSFIKNTDETFEENEHWLSEGRKGVALNLSIEDINYRINKNK